MPKPKRPSRRKTQSPPATEAPAAVDQTADNKKRFIESIAKCGNVSEAARAVPMHRDTHYDWIDADPVYAKAFEKAKDEYRDLVRETVKNRALFGTPQEIYFQGKFLGFRHEHSDRLLELEAKAHCPEYRDKHEITGAAGAPLAIQVMTGVPQPEDNK